MRRQDRDFPTRLNYANEKIREIWMNMVNAKYNSTEDMIDKLQQLKGKTKMKVYKLILIYHYINLDLMKPLLLKMLKVLIKSIMKFWNWWNFESWSLRLRIWILNIMICIILLLKTEMKKKL